MQPNVRSTGLLTHQQGELVPVGFQIAELVKACRRCMGNHRSLMPAAQAVRGHLFGLQPEPCRAEFQVFHTSCTAQDVDTVRQTGQHPVLNKPRELYSRHTSQAGLGSCEQTPLALS